MKKRILLFIPVMLLLFNICLHAQQTWEKIFPGYPLEDICNGSCQLPDGNFLLAGIVNTPYPKLKILKIKPNGDTIWSKVIGNNGQNFKGYNTLANSDGTFMVTGMSIYGGFLMKFNNNGDTLWNKNYEIFNQSPTEITKASENRFLIKGVNFFSLISSDGNLIWSHFASGLNEKYRRICRIEDNYFALASTLLQGNHVYNFITKYDFNQKVIWQKNIDSFKGSPDNLIYKNKIYHIWGAIGSPTVDSTKFYIGKLDSNGNIISGAQILSHQQEIITDGIFEVLNDDKYVSSTYHATLQFPETTKCVIRIFNSKGNVLTTKEILNPYSGFNIFTNFLRIDNSDFLFTGYYQKDYEGSKMDFYAIRTDSNLYFKPVGIVNQNTTLNNFILYQNYPNPFNPSTKISYSLKKSSSIELKLFDINGRMIKIIQSGFKPSGSYEINFSSDGLSSGVYFFSLYSEGILMDTKKAVILK